MGKSTQRWLEVFPYHSRGAMGDVAKVLGVSEQQIRRLTKRFPYARARDMPFSLKSEGCRDLPLNEEPYECLDNGRISGRGSRYADASLWIGALGSTHP